MISSGEPRCRPVRGCIAPGAHPGDDLGGFVNDTLKIVLLIIAALCFAAAAFFRGRAASSIDLVAAGLFAWVLVPLLTELT